MHEVMAVTKALADENRVRLLLALQERELCVCQMVELLGLAPSTVSKHLAILKQARLVESRKEERWMYYRQSNHAGPPFVREAVVWLSGALSQDPKISKDVKNLSAILKKDRADLCRKHMGK
ncbi:MAG: metalloregulator ArsR/SmtB family transcription factor [bacterium]